MSKKLVPVGAKAKKEGLVFACVLDGKGGATALDWDGVAEWRREDGPVWIHLERRSPATVTWLEAESTIPADARKALLAKETRPRVINYKSGTMVVLRGINHNPGEEPDDMVAIRIWIEENRVISLRHRRLTAPRAMYAVLTGKGSGPRTPAEIFVNLADRLTEQMNEIVGGLDDQLDDIEETLDTSDITQMRGQLGEIRQSCVMLRRYIAPQREALSTLRADPPRWMGMELGPALRESEESLLRYIEELDTARDRAVVIRDEIANRLSEDMNRTMYTLSVIAGIILPLSLVTGLLGINVGGIPGTDSVWAFPITCVLLVVLAVGEVWLFRRLKWI